jgi:PilZ domain
MTKDKKAGLRCPFCGSARIRRSRRRGFAEHVQQLLRRYPFHCNDCYKRFSSHRLPIEAARHAPSLVKTRPKLLFNAPSLEVAIREKGYPVERRFFSRLSCQIPAQVVVGSGACLTGMVSGISLNGCFIETPNNVPVGSEIDVSLNIRAGARCLGVVRRSHARGMGIEFTHMTAPNFRRLQNIARGSARLQ